MTAARWMVVAASMAIVQPAPVVAQTADQRAVEQAMTESAAGWNKGDVDAFMAIYSDDPQTSFVTKEGLMRGKAAMAASYRKHYDFTDIAKRGVLTFETLDFRRLGNGHALYIGQYLLTYPGGKTQTGPTSLVFAKESGGWKIIADHSG